MVSLCKELSISTKMSLQALSKARDQLARRREEIDRLRLMLQEVNTNLVLAGSLPAKFYLMIVSSLSIFFFI